MQLLKQFMTADSLTLGLGIFLPLWLIALIVLHKICRKKGIDLRLWKLLCCVPALVCLIHFMLRHFSGAESQTAALYGAAYLCGLLFLPWLIFTNRKYGFRIYSAFLFLAVCLGTISISFLSLSVSNYTRLDYTDAFIAMTNQMEKEYVLKEWKEIDFEALRDEFLPLVEKAEQEGDAAGYKIALLKYAYRFNDGHVAAVSVNKKETALDEEVKRRLAGSDYGISLFTLSDGSTIAIQVAKDSSAAEAGIHSGTIITQWDGIPIEEALQSTECVYPELTNFSVAENEKIVRPLFLAGQGGEQITVRFVDDTGAEQTAALKRRGDYYPRLDLLLDRLYQKTSITDKNFNCKMLSADCGYLRISSEESNTFDSVFAIFAGDYPQLKEQLYKELSQMREEGMEKLIIDLRNNTGGSDIMSMTVASLFASEDDFGHALGERKAGEYVSLKQYPMKADGRLSDIKTVVLVNAECCSAGDSMAWYLSKCPNVTIMGLTDSNGVDQNAGGICIMSDGLFAVGYPNGLVLGENNLPLIDTKADRITSVPLDSRIEATKECVLAIFEDGTDYELDYALHFLE